MKTNFSTELYIQAHGKSPKGCDGWGFAISSINGYKWPIRKIHYAPTMTLTEAKRWIKTTIQKEAFDLSFGEKVKSITAEIMP